MPRVYLWTLDSPVIVVPAVTGVVYCNQVDGVATEQREAEGFLVPLPKIESWVFNPRWWEKHLNRRMPNVDDARWEEIYSELERVISSAPTEGLISEFRILRDPQNVEAWIKISFVLRDPEDDTQERFAGFLTWENCD